MSTKELLKKIINTPTGIDDLFKIANKKCNVFEYNDLGDFSDIEDLFEEGNSELTDAFDMDLPFDDNSSIILYKTQPDFGHWTMINKNDNGFHFLDSYGDKLDTEQENIDPVFLEESGQNHKYLANLLLGSGKPVYYNHAKLQKLADDVATCGLYCSLYLKFNHMDVDDFAEMIKKLSKKLDMSNDEIIAALSII